MDAWTCSLTVPVATRMGRKGEEDVLSYGFRQIDFLSTGEFYLNGEIVDRNRQPEAPQAANQRARHPPVAKGPATPNPTSRAYETGKTGTMSVPERSSMMAWSSPSYLFPSGRI